MIGGLAPVTQDLGLHLEIVAAQPVLDLYAIKKRIRGFKAGDQGTCCFCSTAANHATKAISSEGQVFGQGGTASALFSAAVAERLLPHHNTATPGVAERRLRC